MIIGTESLKNKKYGEIILFFYIGVYPSSGEGKNIIIQKIYLEGLSPEKVELLNKEDFYIENEEILLLIESVKKVINEQLFQREKENRQIITRHTLTCNFEGSKIILNHKDDYEDILIVNLIFLSERLETAYIKDEKIYFCCYESS